MCVRAPVCAASYTFLLLLTDPPHINELLQLAEFLHLRGTGHEWPANAEREGAEEKEKP